MIQQQYNRISGTGEHSLTHGFGFDWNVSLYTQLYTEIWSGIFLPILNSVLVLHQKGSKEKVCSIQMDLMHTVLMWLI